MPLDRDAIRDRLQNVAGIPDDHTTWWQLGTHDVPALLAEVERQGCIIQDLKVSESRAKALTIKQEIELRLAREVIEETRSLLLPVQAGSNAVSGSALAVRERIAAYDQHLEEASNG